MCTWSLGAGAPRGEKWGCRGAEPCQSYGSAETVLSVLGSHGRSQGDGLEVGEEATSPGRRLGQMPGRRGQGLIRARWGGEEGAGHGECWEVREAPRMSLGPSLRQEQGGQHVWGRIPFEPHGGCVGLGTSRRLLVPTGLEPKTVDLGGMERLGCSSEKQELKPQGQWGLRPGRGIKMRRGTRPGPGVAKVTPAPPLSGCAPCAPWTARPPPPSRCSSARAPGGWAPGRGAICSLARPTAAWPCGT